MSNLDVMRVFTYTLIHFLLSILLRIPLTFNYKNLYRLHKTTTFTNYFIIRSCNHMLSDWIIPHPNTCLSTQKANI